MIDDSEKLATAKAISFLLVYIEGRFWITGLLSPNKLEIFLTATGAPKKNTIKASPACTPLLKLKSMDSN